MDRSSKIFLGGIICATVIVAIGFANTYRLESKLKKIEVECVTEGKQNKPTINFKMICDVEDLIGLDRSSEPLVGIQADIVAAQRKVWKSKEGPYLAAAVVLVLAGIPWVWYFLLRRIRELRDAIAGK